MTAGYAGCRNLTTICATAALTLGLAACGGGGGSKGPGMAALTEMERALALAAAIETAKATGADGTFDDALHGFAPAVTASHDGTTLTVEVSEAGTPRGGTARGGDFVAQDNRTAAIAGWTGTRFARGEEEAAESLVVYTDAGPPEAMAFTPENLNKLREVSGLTGESVPESGLAIEAAWLPVIASTSLAAAGPRGSITYGATGTGQDQGLAFTGTFAGGSGEYRCSGGACSLTLDDRGVSTAMGGAWTFAPAPGARVMVPDYDRLHLGWWLNEEEDGAYGFQTFAGGVGFPAGAADVTAAMAGTATYRGAAAGVYVTMDVSGGQVTRATRGEFTARATLEAHFFGAQDARRGHRHDRLLQARERGADDGVGRGAGIRRPHRRRRLLRRRHRGNARPRDARRRQLGGAVSRDRRRHRSRRPAEPRDRAVRRPLPRRAHRGGVRRRQVAVPADRWDISVSLERRPAGRESVMKDCAPVRIPCRRAGVVALPRELWLYRITSLHLVLGGRGGRRYGSTMSWEAQRGENWPGGRGETRAVRRWLGRSFSGREWGGTFNPRIDTT